MRFNLATTSIDTVIGFWQAHTRLKRALTMTENVRLDAPDIYIVRSQSKHRIRYVVDLRAKTCSCPDFTFRGVTCKHLMAAKLTEVNDE